MPTIMVMPLPSHCSSYPRGYRREEREGGRCQNEAMVWIVAPDGDPVPGGYVCQEHGDAVIKEYAEKLNETWTLIPIVRGIK